MVSLHDVSPWTRSACEEALATLEQGEPSHFDFQTRRTLWYSWTTPARGFVDVSIFSTNERPAEPHYVAVYRGTNFTDLNRIGRFAWNHIRFSSEAGVTYSVVAGGGSDLFDLSINSLFTKNRGIGTILNDD